MEPYKKINAYDYTYKTKLTKEEEKIFQIQKAKEELQRYDYIGIKIATKVATLQDYYEEIEYMQSIRQVIRELEQELKSIQEENEESIEE